MLTPHFIAPIFIIPLLFYFITLPDFFLYISICNSTYPVVYTTYSEKFRIRFIATTFWILFRANRHLLSSLPLLSASSGIFMTPKRQLLPGSAPNVVIINHQSETALSILSFRYGILYCLRGKSLLFQPSTPLQTYLLVSICSFLCSSQPPFWYNPTIAPPNAPPKHRKYTLFIRALD